MTDVFQSIVESKLVISDLTGQNPNVLYETGLAHGQNRHVIVLVQDDRDVPFELKPERYIKYLLNSEGLDELKTKLIRFVRAALNG